PHFRAAAKHFGIPFETFAKETVFIGDTPTDVQVSNNSNIISIVRKSANADETLLDKGAKFVVEDFSNLSEIISAL
ncbi:MAG: HAD hydrolase-like protein, partial [Patescibacteria group bacterium]